MRMLAPNGSLIIGTVELIPGTALATEYSDDGTPEYAGETEVDWDGQRTVRRDDKLLYQGEDGERYTWDQLVPEPVEDEDDE